MPQKIFRPTHLQPGDRVGLITPATAVVDPDALALAERTVKHFGLRVKMGKHVGKRAATHQASVRGRLEDLHAMFADQTVRAIFAVRGGYGAMHLLEGIDYELLRRNPKIFLGFSDLTALHLAIQQRTKLVTFHGPVAIGGFSAYTEEHVRKALFEAQPMGKLTNPVESNPLRPTHSLRTIRSGRATGQLTGGNLSTVCALMGTPFEIDTRGKLLFLEDVDEQPYAIDRLLMQLRLAGKLKDAAGVVIGECANCRPRAFKPSFASPYSFGEVLNHLLADLSVPVLYGLTFGHTSDQLTLPMGVMARLDADAGVLEIIESATS